MTPLENVRNQLAQYYFREKPNSLVNGIAIGSLPESSKERQKKNAPKDEILIFVNPAAVTCEFDGIDRNLKDTGQPYRILFAPQFVALQTQTGASLNAYSPLRYNVPPVCAGTFGAMVKAAGVNYLLSSNHVLALNGRVPERAPILMPGPLDDATGGPVVGLRSYFVALQPPAWPPNGAPANQVDCALAEVNQNISPPNAIKAATPVVPFPGAVARGTIVTKTGRATQTTRSQINIFSWDGYIEFSFGSYFFSGLMGTYDGHNAFAAPGDSGAVAIIESSGQGAGLITARGYVFDQNQNFISYVVLICSLDLVAAALARKMNLNKDDLKFFR